MRPRREDTAARIEEIHALFAAPPPIEMINSIVYDHSREGIPRGEPVLTEEERQASIDRRRQIQLASAAARNDAIRYIADKHPDLWGRAFTAAKYLRFKEENLLMAPEKESA